MIGISFERPKNAENSNANAIDFHKISILILFITLSNFQRYLYSRKNNYDTVQHVIFIFCLFARDREKWNSLLSWTRTIFNGMSYMCWKLSQNVINSPVFLRLVQYLLLLLFFRLTEC